MRPTPAPAPKPILEQRVEFAEKHVTDSKGRRFSLHGREWVRDELWRALDGYQAWPVDRDRLCDGCRSRVDELVDDPSDLAETTTEHEGEGCAGLSAEPIFVVLLCAERRAGKTFNSAAFVLSMLFLELWRAILYVAAAFGQSETLVLDNFKRPIEQNKKLAARAVVRGKTITVPKNHTSFELVPTSSKSITGRGRGLVVVDEARDLEFGVAAALLPSILESGGWICPHGHVRLDRDQAPPDRRCPACGAALRQWFGRALIMSSAGVLKNAPKKDWFANLVKIIEEGGPRKNWHLIRKDEGANPLKNEAATTAIEDVLVDLPGAEEFVAAEFGNTFASGGEYVSDAVIERCVDKSLRNAGGATGRCLAFLDASIVGDLTSIVWLADDPAPPGDPARKPWEYVVANRIDLWDPKQLPGGMIDERVIEAHLAEFVPLFPGLIRLAVDVRGLPWAKRLVQRCRTTYPGWGRKIEPYTSTATDDRRTAWALFEDRIRARTLRLPPNAQLRREIAGLRKKARPDGRADVVDASRRTAHADISSGIATGLLLIHHLQVQSRMGLAQTEERLSRTSREILAKAFGGDSARVRAGGQSFGPDSF